MPEIDWNIPAINPEIGLWLRVRKGAVYGPMIKYPGGDALTVPLRRLRAGENPVNLMQEYATNPVWWNNGYMYYNARSPMDCVEILTTHPHAGEG